MSSDAPGMCSQRAVREKGEIHQLNPTDPALGLTWMGDPSAVNPASSNPKNIPPERETFRLPEAAKCKSSTEMPKIFHVQCLAVHSAPPLSSLNIPKEQEPLGAEILPGNTPRLLEKLTLAVLSLEAVMNMVMSREVWMSLICFVCSLIFDSCSPDWRGRDNFRGSWEGISSLKTTWEIREWHPGMLWVGREFRNGFNSTPRGVASSLARPPCI